MLFSKPYRLPAIMVHILRYSYSLIFRLTLQFRIIIIDYFAILCAAFLSAILNSLTANQYTQNLVNAKMKRKQKKIRTKEDDT